MSKYSTILFDMDGTLVDTDELIVQTFFTLYDMYKNGQRRDRSEIYYFSGPPIRETLAKEFPNYDRQFILDEFHRISWDYYPKYTKSFPHVKETLLKLKENGYKLGIVTNKIHKTTLYCLEILKLEGIFDVVIGFDDVKEGKPKPEGIYKAMKMLDEDNINKVIYIGDNGSDYLTASNAGCDSALLYWGPRVIDPSVKPTYKVNSYEELEEVFL